MEAGKCGPRCRQGAPGEGRIRRPQTLASAPCSSSARLRSPPSSSAERLGGPPRRHRRRDAEARGSVREGGRGGGRGPRLLRVFARAREQHDRRALGRSRDGKGRGAVSRDDGAGGRCLCRGGDCPRPRWIVEARSRRGYPRSPQPHRGTSLPSRESREALPERPRRRPELLLQSHQGHVAWQQESEARGRTRRLSVGKNVSYSQRNTSPRANWHYYPYDRRLVLGRTDAGVDSKYAHHGPIFAIGACRVIKIDPVGGRSWGGGGAMYFKLST